MIIRALFVMFMATCLVVSPVSFILTFFESEIAFEKNSSGDDDDDDDSDVRHCEKTRTLSFLFYIRLYPRSATGKEA